MCASPCLGGHRPVILVISSQHLQQAETNMEGSSLKKKKKRQSLSLSLLSSLALSLMFAYSPPEERHSSGHTEFPFSAPIFLILTSTCCLTHKSRAVTKAWWGDSCFPGIRRTSCRQDDQQHLETTQGKEWLSHQDSSQ